MKSFGVSLKKCRYTYLFGLIAVQKLMKNPLPWIFSLMLKDLKGVQKRSNMEVEDFRLVTMGVLCLLLFRSLFLFHWVGVFPIYLPIHNVGEARLYWSPVDKEGGGS